MSSCYRQQRVTYKDPIFTYVKTSVVLLMENSKREQRVKSELERFPVTRNIIFQYNKGFKKCKKPLSVDTTSKDILHALVTALKSVVVDGPILVLESDVSFNPQIREYVLHVEKFLRTNSQWEVYSLGSNCIFARPTLSRHVRTYYMAMAHAWIFSPSMIERMILERFSQRVYDIMIKGMTPCRFKPAKDMAISSISTTYMHRVPLAFQPHPKTENSLTWMNEFPLNLLKMVFHASAEKDGTQLYKVLHAMTYTGGMLPTFLIGILLLGLLVKNFCESC